MRYFLTLFIVASCLSLVGQDWRKEKPLIEHLSTVNSFWQTQDFEQDERYGTAVRFRNDTERIQKHLSMVERILRRRDVADLTATQQANRMALLDTLGKYWETRTFPVNSYHLYRQPYFIDNHGTACAVGYLMIKSGYSQLAEKIAIENNYVFVEELLKDESVMAWAGEHGFEWEELAWIQPGYEVNLQWQSLGSGVDGPVTGMASIGYGNPGSQEPIMIVGDFNEAGNTACNNAVIWDNGQYKCAGEGLQGIVEGIYSYGDELAAYGQFTSDGRTYDYAQWTDEQWEYYNLSPAGNGHIYAMIEKGLDLYYAGSYFDSARDQQIYYVGSQDKITDSHNLLLELDGPVFAMAPTSFAEIAVAGNFSNVTNKFSFIQKTKIVNNIIAFSRYHDSLLISLGDGLNDTVWALENVGNILYAGGNLFDGKDNPSFGFSRYQNGTWQQLIDPFRHSGDSASGAIEDIAYNANSFEMLLAGEFEASGFQYFGHNLGAFNAFSGTLSPKGNFNEAVHTIHTTSNGVYVGGQFTKEKSTEMGHLAVLESKVTGVSEKMVSDLQAYPNPAKNFMTIEGSALQDFPSLELRVFNVQGQHFPVAWDREGTTLRLDVTTLSSGLYFYEVAAKGKRLGNGRIVIE